MNAPFDWPTNYPLPKFRITRVAMAGIGVLLASCSDTLTTPGERPPTSDPVPSLAAPNLAAPDVVVIERTTTDPAVNGEAPIVHYSREVLTAQVRMTGRIPDVRALPSAPAESPKGMPRPPLSLPARREVAICNALPSWTERTRSANGHDLVLGGVGDAPASSMKVMQADGSIWTVERSWTRTSTSWQLDRQVTRGSNGYKDVVTYRHQDALGKVVNNALPTASCTGQQQLSGPPSVAASLSFYPSYSGALYSKLVPGSGVTADEGCWEGGSDPCYDKRVTVYKDDIALVVAASGMTLACVTPANVLVAPCIAATTFYLSAVAILAIDQASYQKCLDDAAAAPKPSGPELSVGQSALTLASAATHARLSVAGIGAATLKNCGGGNSSGTSYHCHWDTYEISYDHGVTWVLFASFLICDDAT